MNNYLQEIDLIDTAKETPKPSDKCYYGLLGDIAKSLTVHSEANPIALLANLLSFSGTVLGKSIYFLQGSESYVYPNLYLVHVGKTGLGRKGTTTDILINGIVKTISNLEGIPNPTNKVVPELFNGALGSTQGIVSLIHDGRLIDPKERNNSKEKKPKKKKTTEANTEIDTEAIDGQMVEITDFCKSQRKHKFKHENQEKENNVPLYIDPPKDDKRLFMVFDELVELLNKNKKDTDFSNLIRRAYDNKTLGTVTKYDNMQVKEPHIGILGHITPEELQKNVKQEDIDNGYLNRFLFLYANRNKELKQQVSPTLKAKINELNQMYSIKLIECFKSVNSHNQKAKDRKRIMFNSEAEDYFYSEINNKLNISPYEKINKLFQRVETNIVKIALIYCVLDQKTEIEKVHLESAKSFIEYCILCTIYLFTSQDDIRENKLIKSIENKIIYLLNNQPNHTATLTEISKCLNNRNQQYRDTALQNLLNQSPPLLNKQTYQVQGKLTTQYTLIETIN